MCYSVSDGELSSTGYRYGWLSLSLHLPEGVKMQVPVVGIGSDIEKSMHCRPLW